MKEEKNSSNYFNHAIEKSNVQESILIHQLSFIMRIIRFPSGSLEVY